MLRQTWNKKVNKFKLLKMGIFLSECDVTWSAGQRLCYIATSNNYILNISATQ